MSGVDIDQQIDDLITAVEGFGRERGSHLARDFDSHCVLMLSWLQFLRDSKRTENADILLVGAISSIREAVACASLGLVRPAIFSMRMNIDLLFAWLYFKDHPVEWRNLNETGEGFKMKKEIFEYLASNYTGFKARHSLLKAVMDRSTEDPYRLLSAHIHAQSEAVMPDGEDLASVVQSYSLASQIPKIIEEVSEYVGDVLICVYIESWLAIPDEIKGRIERRLARLNNHRVRFFEGT